MPKALTAILILLPSLAFAECGFTRSGNSMTIVVGGNPKCLSSESFREAFKAGIAQGLEEDEAARNAQHKRAYDDRNHRSAKLWAIAEQQHRANQGGRYFGQQR